MLDSVFDLFVQSKRTLDRAAGGLGVGLTLVRSLVTLHGGTVLATSDGEGKGTEFVVRLPLSSGDEPLEPTRPSVPEPRLRERTKIVVVEDNADSREMLCKLLEQAGFECHTAETGTAALVLIDAIRPRIAILDVGLPGMDGLELARRIRQNPEHAGIHLVALTGYGRASDRAVARDAGFDEHVVKPVQARPLIHLLDEMRAGSFRPAGPPLDGCASGQWTARL
jgi:two-component system CheB/CheR fusion protein